MSLAYHCLTLIAGFLWSSIALAAACCGGGSSFPSLITGDYRQQVSISYSHGKAIGDSTQPGPTVFYTDDKRHLTHTLKLEAIRLFGEYLQLGLGLPYQQKNHNDSGHIVRGQGVGDLEFQVAYEWLPELRYSWWKPRGFVFAKGTAPTGNSIYELQGPRPTDITGKGFFTLSVGTSLLKIVGPYDMQFMLEAHQSLPRRFSSQGASLRVEPGSGASLLLAAGISPDNNNFRFGYSLSPHYEGSRTSQFAGKSSTSDFQLYWDSSFSVSYMFNNRSSVSGIYTDQTLMGPVHNATLSRTLSVLFQHRLLL